MSLLTTTPVGAGQSGQPLRRVPPAPRVRRIRADILGLLPFASYLLLFLAVPTVLAVGSGFFDSDGGFTLDNVAALAEPVIVATFANSISLSLLTAVLGAVLGALLCYALLGFRADGSVRATVAALSGVLAQFGGVMLAFAFVATIGLQGLVTVWLRDSWGIDIFAEGAWIYGLPGLVLPYIYFQVPLMVITFMPALTALKGTWVEATLTLGGTPAAFWRRVALPVLAPSFLASFLLLFANAFSSYATAAALASQGSQIVPLQIRAALTSETVLGRENLAGALALGMIIVMGLVMWAYAVVQGRAARWQK
ncbi:ABC transporter permease [Microterricola viridarii]|uniref:Putative spermidine/putrescine transport system permease protein n=1 Tax=Microterricola viridarii TaxID=412690 RepID=A0A1H1XMT9_9MICO|nr:ABC transporter permease subunit [Microterricola viridarii]SDT10534.1 putative spermidine/putrescine transport system permease protein [Microterricola viridarii]